MYDFVLLENESISLISDKALLKYHDKALQVTVILTNERMLLLSYPQDQESFRFGKIINHPIKKEVLFATPLNQLKNVEAGKEYDHYILKDDNYFYLKDDRIKNAILSIK